MKLTETAIKGVFVADTSAFTDARGSFSRFFCADALRPAIGARAIRQINHSYTAMAGVVRGLHFQHPPHAEMKMVRCLAGRMLDVAVDLRRGSPTFLKHHAEILTPENARMLIVPEGFAHGFQALVSDTEMLYANTAFYDRQAEDGVRPDDPALGIDWPLPPVGISERDRSHPLIGTDFEGIAP